MGRPWRLTAYQRPGQPAWDAGTFGITLLLAPNGQASGFAGCNDYSGAYLAGANQAPAFGPLVATQKACASAVMECEQLYLQGLQAVAQYHLDGNSLRLILNNGQGMLTYAGTVSGPIPRSAPVRYSGN